MWTLFENIWILELLIQKSTITDKQLALGVTVRVLLVKSDCVGL